MKRISLWIVCVVMAATFAAAQRLPELAVPENYKLSFAPDFSKDNFAGEETIQIRVLKASPQIVLNSAQVDFQSATISSAGTTQTAKVSLDKEKEMATLV